MSLVPLPIDEILGPLLRTLRSTQAVVVDAPPGAGKTTRLPHALLAAGWGAEREIWVAEPRARTAQLAADFVARQLGESVGARVGYRLRFEQRGGPETRLRFVTDGVLLERLSSTERGTGIGVVVLDEFHERRVATDLSLMLSRRRLAADAGLRIVVLSATHDAAAVAAYLGDCPRLRCSEPASAVQIEHEAASEQERPLHLRVAGAVERLVRAAPRGDILTFLPGAAEIERAQDALRSFANEQALDLVTLHEELPLELSARAIAAGQRRRVVLATDLAESSVSVEGISAVVDSGLARSTEHSPWTDRQLLVLRPISRAAAARRAARAGGREPGHVVRLYTAASLHARPEHEQPELERLDLTGPLLTLYACKVPLTPELWLTAPSAAALEEAGARLERLGLASGDRVTDLGRRASALPVPPRLALVALAGAELGIPRRVCLAVALLAERDIRAGAAANGRGLGTVGCDCDLEHLIALYTAAQAERFAPAALRQLGLCLESVEVVRHSYEQLLRNLTARHPAADEATLDAADTRSALGLALLAGFPDRVARRSTPNENELLLSTGQVALLVPESVARTSPLLLAVEAEERVSADDRAEPRSQLRVRLASPIEASWLIDHAPAGLSERELLEWDDQREQAILISQLCWGEVVLHHSVRPAYPGIATGVLVERAALSQLETLFGKAETLPEIVARSELVAQYLPELELQRVNELGSRGLLRAACARVISLAEVRELDWRAVFVQQLSPEQRRELERQAPEHIVLTGGRRVRVQYARGQAPFIAARLQDFFGMQAGPAILSGRVPLTLHLLAPNQRAVQITADLADFWQRDYASLRRELSRRYPRDAWPEEPRTATAPRSHEPR
ncbi:MAG: ATP-dependent helicase C-terminal domain-containing protein [Deltaproteobacteria bacterium]